MAPGSGPSTLISLSNVPTSATTEQSSGLQALRVQSVQSDGQSNQISAQLGSQSVQFSSEMSPPKGAVLLGRLQGQGSDAQLNVLTTKQQIEQVQTESLMKLLSGSGLDPGSDSARSLMSKLSRQGYLSANDLERSGESGASTDNSLTGKTLTVTSGSESMSTNLNEGTVTKATVMDAGGDTARLDLNGNRVTVQNPGGLTEGASLTVQVKQTGNQPALEVQSVQNTSGAPKVLNNLSQALGIDSSTESLNRLETVMQRTQGRSPDSVLTEIKREFGNSVKIPTGEARESTLNQIRAYRNDPSESVLRELADRLNLSEENESMKRLRSVLLQNRGSEARQVIEQIQREFSTVNSRALEGSRGKIEKLIEQFQQGTKTSSSDRTGVQNLKNLGNNQLSNLLQNLGFEPDEKLMRTARQIIQADPSPTQENLKTVLENVQLAQSGDGSLDSDRLRGMLFLAKNNLPVNQETVDILRLSTPGEASTDRSQTTNLLQNLTATGDNSSEQLPDTLQNALQATQVSPGGGGENSESLAARLADAVRSMGFDLENQVGKNPDRARKSLRSQMMALQQNLADQASETLLQGQSGDSNSRESSRTFLSQMMKHSLASVADDDSIFLFVPFPDGEGTGLMRMRFEDEGEGDEVDNEEWTVTINVDLSQLGPMQVRARRHRERLNLTFKASDSDTVHLIDQHRERLEENLVEKGFEVSLRTQPWNEEDDALVDWNLYFDKGDYSGTFDVTV